MKKIFLLSIIAALMIVARVGTAPAQEETTLRVSTFGRQISFIAATNSTHLQVMEAGQRVEPESLQVEAIDQVIVAFDVSDSMKYLLPEMIKHIKKSLPSQPNLPIMIATFGEDVKVLADFTTSRTTIENALGNVKAGKHLTRLYAAIRDFQQRAGARRTHLLLVTDGTDTTETKINVKALLAESHLTISYLYWGIGDASLAVDEPGYERAAKSALVKRAPNSLLSSVAQASGGDVMNFTDWKPVSQYFAQRFASGNYVYSLFWHTDNPERSVSVKEAGPQQTLIAQRTR
jgi:hypothetical protein